MTTAVGLITPEKIIKFLHISQKQMEELQKGSSIWGNILDPAAPKNRQKSDTRMGCSTRHRLWAPLGVGVLLALWGTWKPGEGQCRDRGALNVLGWKDGCLSGGFS